MALKVQKRWEDSIVLGRRQGQVDDPPALSLSDVSSRRSPQE